MTIFHSVYFYFKDDVSDQQIELQRLAIINDLSKIPIVNKIWAGGPAGIKRDVVDNTYGMSLHTIFNNREALDTYQAHELHLKFLDTFKKNWVKVIVYDSAV